MVRHAQCHFSLFIVKAGNETLGHERPDLLLRKVYHGYDQLSHELSGLVKIGYLRARFPGSELLAEVHLKHVSGFACFGKRLGADDAPYSQLDSFEIIPANRVQFERLEFGRHPLPLVNPSIADIEKQLLVLMPMIDFRAADSDQDIENVQRFERRADKFRLPGTFVQ